MNSNVYSKKLTAVWGRDYLDDMNITLSFTLKLKKQQSVFLSLSASSCYKLYADGVMLAFGPQRAAHGYARVQEFSFKAKEINVLVHNLGVTNFCWVKQPPFFACEVIADEGEKYTSKDFDCYLIDDRVKKVQRYSYQRGFAEVYNVKSQKESVSDVEDNFERIESVVVDVPKLLNSNCLNAKLGEHYSEKVIDSGSVTIDDKKEVWRDRVHYQIGEKTGGFTIDEWTEFPTDEACKFVYHPDKEGDLIYKTYDFGRSITGFSELKVKAKKGSKVYLIFDELLKDNKTSGDNIDFTRNTCSNVFKWMFEREGEYEVSCFEPYTLRYAKIVCDKSCSVEMLQRDYKNPDTENFKFTCQNKKLQRIVESAVYTFAQNAADLLTDCPSRERSGWLADSWFSSVAEKVFTGKNNAEKTFLENYIDYTPDKLPKGIIPMNYPADDYDGMYIPNWNMWYILEIGKYQGIYGNDDIVINSKDNVYGILDYFKTKENELGLLEDLESWVFVEWSAANDQSHICGVNIPSNISYAACLIEAGKVYNDNALIEKAENIIKTIKKIGFDGRFFVDNLIRDQKNCLKQTSNYTEVCQYYAFWFNCLTKEEYSDLFAELMNKLGTERKDGYMPEMEKPNVMFGIYMRMDLLLRLGEREKVLKEVIKIFYDMAEKTGTLWEHNNTSASCNHGFASYAIRWLIFALTGYDVLENNEISSVGLGIDCEIEFPKGACKYKKIKVKDNIVTAE